MQGRAAFHIHLFRKTMNQTFSTQTNDWRVFCEAEELGSSPPCHGLSYTATRLHRRSNFDKRTFRQVPWAMDGLLSQCNVCSCRFCSLEPWLCYPQRIQTDGLILSLMYFIISRLNFFQIGMCEPIWFCTKVSAVLSRRTPCLAQFSKTPTLALTQYPSFRASRIPFSTLWTVLGWTERSRLNESPVARPGCGAGSCPIIIAFTWSGGTIWNALKIHPIFGFSLSPLLENLPEADWRYLLPFFSRRLDWRILAILLVDKTSRKGFAWGYGSHSWRILGAVCTCHRCDAIPHLPEALSLENYALRNDLNGFNWGNQRISR